MLLIETAIGLVANSAMGLNPLKKHWYCIPCCQPRLHLLGGCVVSSRSGQAARLSTVRGLFTQWWGVRALGYSKVQYTNNHLWQISPSLPVFTGKTLTPEQTAVQYFTGSLRAIPEHLDGTNHRGNYSSLCQGSQTAGPRDKRSFCSSLCHKSAIVLSVSSPSALHIIYL